MKTFTGQEYLKIDVASNFGLDKKDWEDRIAWFNENENQLESLVNEADNPPLFFASVQAWRDVKAGRPTGYTTSLDAAASGLQILACLSACETSARICGVLSTGHREDAYMNFYQIMKNMVGEKLGAINRGIMKVVSMTAFYDSTREPKKVFGDGPLLEAFWETLAKGAPGAWALNKAMKKLWQPYTTAHEWTLPDNFHVHVPVTATVGHLLNVAGSDVVVEVNSLCGSKSGQAMGANIVHSVDGLVVREMHRRCSYDADLLTQLMELIQGGIWNQMCTGKRPQDTLVAQLWNWFKDTGFLSARILELLDKDNLCLVNVSIIKSLIETLPDVPFEVISIHDCFRAHPNHGNDLRRTYNTILAQITHSRLMDSIASQITKTPIHFTKGNLTAAQVMQADYALC